MGDARRHLTNPNTVILLMGNKIDLTKQRQVTYEEASKFAEENGLIFIETSAKTGDNVEEMFLRTARKIYENIQAGSLDLNPQQSGVHFVKPTSVTPPTQSTSGSKC